MCDICVRVTLVYVRRVYNVCGAPSRSNWTALQRPMSATAASESTLSIHPFTFILILLIMIMIMSILIVLIIMIT